MGEHPRFDADDLAGLHRDWIAFIEEETEIDPQPEVSDFLRRKEKAEQRDIEIVDGVAPLFDYFLNKKLLPPMNIGTFMDFRYSAIYTAVALNKPEYFSINWLVKNRLPESVSTNYLKRWFSKTGLAMPTEVARITDAIWGMPDNDFTGVHDQTIQDEMPSMAISEGSRMSLPYALEEMNEDMRIGKRVVVTLLSGDVGTPGQSETLSEAGYLAGQDGVVIAFVWGDKEIELVKGKGRPYVPLRGRLTMVQNHQSVKLAVPLEFPGVNDIDRLINAHTDFHKLLSGRAHMRLVGEQDQWFETYKMQCEAANIGLVFSQRKRSMSATELGQKLREDNNL